MSDNVVSIKDYKETKNIMADILIPMKTIKRMVKLAMFDLEDEQIGAGTFWFGGSREVLFLFNLEGLRFTMNLIITVRPKRMKVDTVAMYSIGDLELSLVEVPPTEPFPIRMCKYNRYKIDEDELKEDINIFLKEVSSVISIKETNDVINMDILFKVSDKVDEMTIINRNPKA